jgi:ABC-type multidrug transport system, ATPase and permease components
MVGKRRKNLFLWIGAAHGGLLAGYIAGAFLLNVIVIQGNDYIAQAIDRVLAGQAVEIRTFLLPLVLMIAAGTLTAYLKSLCGNHYSAVVARDVRNTLGKHLMGLPFRYFDEKGSGSVMTKLSSDIGESGRFFSEILPEFLVNVITVVTVTVYLVRMDVMLIVILFASYPLMLLVANWLSRRLEKVVVKWRTNMDIRTQTAYDAVQGIVTGRSYNLYETMKRRIDGIIDTIAEHGCASTRITSMGWVVKNVMTTIPVTGCYLFALHEMLVGRITTGDMISFTVLMGRILYPIGDVVFCLNDFRQAGVSMKRLQELYEAEAENGMEAEAKTEMESKAGMESKAEAGGILQKKDGNVLAWEDVRFGYHEGQMILNGISFEIKQGETVAFVGGSGEGKSTVFRLLCGFYPRMSGRYLLYGQDYECWDLQAARACFSLVSQNVFLFPVSIRQNVACGKEGATEEEIVEACKNANIHELILKLPQGYDTVVGERGTRLSGGEKQRISIARAFLKDAPILLMDEPTAAVDEGTEREIQEAVARISRGRTVLIIAHRLSTVRQADFICVLKQGRIAERGTHQELLELGGAYAGLYGAEREKETDKGPEREPEQETAQGRKKEAGKNAVWA